MAADGFSKPLLKKVFQRFMTQIGMVLKGKGAAESES
jgi:hypothetical protein